MLNKTDREKLREIKYILKEYTNGIIPINNIAWNCLMTKMPIETVHELGQKMYDDMHTTEKIRGRKHK